MITNAKPSTDDIAGNQVDSDAGLNALVVNKYSIRRFDVDKRADHLVVHRLDKRVENACIIFDLATRRNERASPGSLQDGRKFGRVSVMSEYAAKCLVLK